MKKILYLVMIAFSLQSCLNDKENESDLFNSVGKDLSSISFGEAERLSKVDVFATKEADLPVIELSLRNTTQEFDIPIVLLTKPLDRDVVVTLKLVPVNIDTYNATKVGEFNTLRAQYETLLGQYVTDKRIYDDAVAAGTPLPPVPVKPEAPAIILPYVPLPDGKYTVSKTVTIAKGSRSASATVSVPNALADFSLDFKYMLPITLEVSDPKVRVANPITLISVGAAPFSPLAGKYIGVGVSNIYTGPNFTEFVWDEFEYNWTIPIVGASAGCTDCVELPFGAGLNRVNIPLPLIQFTFQYNAADPNASTMTAGQASGGTIGASAAPLTSNPQIVGKPVLRFSSSGQLLSIKRLTYKYTNGAGNLRVAILDSVYRVVK